MNTSPSIVETDRLLLRSWSTDDAAAVYGLWSDPLVMRFVGPPIRSPNDARTWLRWAIAYENENQFCRWPIVEKESGLVVGCCGLLYQNEDNEVDLGYYLIPSKWGMGYATEISAACVRYAFDTLGLRELIATVDINNPRSTRVLDKCGFKFRKVVQNDDGTVDYLYSISKVDLRARQEKKGLKLGR